MTDRQTARLNDLQPGQSGEVTALSGQDTRAQRLMAMGVIPGIRLKVVRVAPLGDPITVQLPGCEVSLRRSEAATVTVRVETAA